MYNICEQDLLTFIIPVYNGRRKIKRCIDSICNQQYSGKIELIILDDGSTDDSLNIIKKYIELVNVQNIEVRLIEKSNSGVADTRNLGIISARGEYIAFIDQDDYVANDYCNLMMQAIKKSNADIVVAGYIRVDENDKELYRYVLSKSEWAPYMVTAPWAHIYRTDFLRKNKITFLKTGIGEDVYFNLIAYECASKIEVCSYEGYYWLNNKQSVSNTNQVRISEKNNPFILLDNLQMELEKRKLENTPVREYFMLRYIVWYILYTLRGSDWKDICVMQNRLFNWLELYYPEYKKNKYISLTKPKDDIKVNRYSVWILIKAKKWHFINPILKCLKYGMKLLK